jgi:hypothetical protein
MFYKIALFLGGMKKVILEAKTAQDVDAIKKTPTQSTCLYYDHDNEASKCASEGADTRRAHRGRIHRCSSSVALRWCPGHDWQHVFRGLLWTQENIWRQGASNHHSRFQERSSEELSWNEENFYYLLKQYLAKSGGKKDGAELEKQQTDLFNGVRGNDDDDGAAAGVAAAGGAAAEESAAAPEPEASHKPEGRIDLE